VTVMRRREPWEQQLDEACINLRGSDDWAEGGRSTGVCNARWGCSAVSEGTAARGRL